MKNYARLFQFLLAIGLMLFVLINFHLKVESSKQSVKKSSDTVLRTDSMNSYQRSWLNYNWDSFSLSYAITSLDYHASKQQKNQQEYPNHSAHRTYESYWGAIYRELLIKEKDFVAEIADSLGQIRAVKDLDEIEFADLIVSFVQDYPYTYIFDGQSCDTTDIPCVNGQSFGIHTPTEFLYTLQGDCDTRSVLLYGVLRHFGYDAHIAISYFYAHALIVINLSTTGEFIERLGKKYYFWETTAPGWQKGFLPPAFADASKWHIAL